MADLERIKKLIQEIAGRPKSVTLEEIQKAVEQLGKVGYDVNSRPARHGILFRVNDRTFMVSGHNPGNSQVKSYAVKEFLKAMINLGLYEADES